MRALGAALSLALAACEGASQGSAAGTLEASTTAEATATDDQATGDPSGDPVTTGGAPVCGDGVIEGDEVCDGPALGDRSCPSEGFVDGGELSCAATCTLDAGACVRCTAWLREFGTFEYDGGNAVALDGDANVNVVGSVETSLDGETSLGGRDGVLRQYSSSGVKLWTRQFGSDGEDGASAVATDSTAAIYVAGRTAGSVDGTPQAGNGDVMLYKFAVDGTQVWVRQFGSAEIDSAMALVVDAADHVYVAGHTGGSLPGNTSAGALDLYLSKFTPEGERLWIKQIGTSGDDYGWEAAIDASDHVYVVGATGGSFGGPVLGDLDAFVVKFDADGAEHWRQQFGTPQEDSAESVSLDADGNLYIAGDTLGAIDGQVNQGSADFYVRKIDADGAWLWTRQIGTADFDVVRGVEVRGDGGYYLVGVTDGTFPGNENAGVDDVYVARFDASGAEVWTQQFGSPVYDVLKGSAMDAAENLYAVGNAGGSLFGQPHAFGGDIIVLRICGS